MLVAAGVFFDIFRYGSYNKFTPFGPAELITSSTSYIGFGLAGLLVGFGTKLGNGCTSGHGLCGLPRISIRSIVAVAVFLCSAIAIATLRYHVGLGPFSDGDLSSNLSYEHYGSANVCIGIGVLLPLIGWWMRGRKVQDGDREGKKGKESPAEDQLLTFIIGVIFGAGLLLAGMIRRSNILGFLSMGSDWNPSLMFVLGCGVLLNIFTFNYMLRVRYF